MYAELFYHTGYSWLKSSHNVNKTNGSFYVVRDLGTDTWKEIPRLGIISSCWNKIYSFSREIWKGKGDGNMEFLGVKLRYLVKLYFFSLQIVHSKLYITGGVLQKHLRSVLDKRLKEMRGEFLVFLSVEIIFSEIV